MSSGVERIGDSGNIYGESRAGLLRFIESRVGNPDVAEEILHDVFEKVVTRLDSVRESTSVRAWLFQVTRNTIVDHFRANRPHSELPVEVSFDGDEEDVASRLALCLQPMVEALPEKSRGGQVGRHPGSRAQGCRDAARPVVVWGEVTGSARAHQTQVNADGRLPNRACV